MAVSVIPALKSTVIIDKETVSRANEIPRPNPIVVVDTASDCNVSSCPSIKSFKMLVVASILIRYNNATAGVIEIVDNESDVIFNSKVAFNVFVIDDIEFISMIIVCC